jgi:hypothetical protein
MTIEHEHETITSGALGHDGDPCAYCGAALARDQRYCLNCGRRRPEVRTPFAQRERLLGTAPAISAAPSRAPVVIAGRPVSPVALGTGLGIFVIALLLGVLIGNGGNAKPLAAAPQVIKVSAPAAAAPAQPAAFTSDWPSGKEGYTVQLQTIAKAGAQANQVAQAKSAAQSRGATEVSALDSDAFASLGPGNYVLYSGVYGSRKQAARALKGLKAKFPGATVVKVSASAGSLAGQGDKGALSGKKKSATVGKKQLEQLKKLSPGQYQKKSSKLPDNTKLPGKAPPKDKKKPGGGGGGQTIG